MSCRICGASGHNVATCLHNAHRALNTAMGSIDIMLTQKTCPFLQCEKIRRQKNGTNFHIT